MKVLRIEEDRKSGLTVFVLQLSREEYDLLKEVSSLVMKTPSAIIRDAIYLLVGRHLDLVPEGSE
jgi:hypothetical protein